MQLEIGKVSALRIVAWMALTTSHDWCNTSKSKQVNSQGIDRFEGLFVVSAEKLINSCGEHAMCKPIPADCLEVYSSTYLAPIIRGEQLLFDSFYFFLFLRIIKDLSNGE